jgi:LPXTG-motif cell wall-anchored protein
MQIFKTAVKNAKTHDIIYSLCMAVPAAIKQVKQFNLVDTIGLSGNDVIRDAELTGQWIRKNVTYKIDTFKNQNIQLPSALLKSGTGDCKSISLLYLAIMEAAGYNGGFRFAGYRGNNFTHVYNFFANKNNIVTFDACIKNLKEITTFTKIKDMRVNYLAGTPMMIDETGIERLPSAEELMQDDRIAGIDGIGRLKLKVPKIKIPPFVNKLIPKGPGLPPILKPIATVGLAPARGPFLLLTNLNVRGIAKRLQTLKDKNLQVYTEFWTKLGGDINKLNEAVEKGKNKKAIFGERRIGEANFNDDEIVVGEYIGEPVTLAAITAAISAASGIIAQLMKLLKKNNVAEEPGEPPLDEGIDPNTPLAPGAEPGEPVIPNDPASEGAGKYIQKGIDFLKGTTSTPPKIKPRTTRPSGTITPSNTTSTAASTGTSFSPSPLLIGGGIAAIAAIYFLTKKRKK